MLEVISSLIDCRKGQGNSPNSRFRLFPSIGNVSELNEAKIKGLRNTFNNNNKSVFATIIGAKNYEALMAQTDAYSQYANQLATGGSAVDEYLNSLNFGTGSKSGINPQKAQQAKKAGNVAAWINPVTAPIQAARTIARSLPAQKGASTAAKIATYTNPVTAAIKPAVSNGKKVLGKLFGR